MCYFDEWDSPVIMFHSEYRQYVKKEYYLVSHCVSCVMSLYRYTGIEKQGEKEEQKEQTSREKHLHC